MKLSELSVVIGNTLLFVHRVGAIVICVILALGGDVLYLVVDVALLIDGLRVLAGML